MRHQPSAASWPAPSLPGVELFRATRLTERYALHSHDAYAIGVFEEGVGGTTYRGATRYIPRGHIVAMDPGEPHTGFAAEPRGITYRMFYVEERAFDEILEGPFRPRFAEVCIADHEAAGALLQAHRALENLGEPLGHETDLVTALSAFARRHGSSPWGTAPTNVPAAIARAKEYLAADLARSLTIRDVASASGLSAAHFIRAFRRATGLPPHAWRLQIRIARAKQRLAAGHPPADVAVELGFADQSHLTRRFRRVTGVTPAAYAARHVRAAAGRRRESR